MLDLLIVATHPDDAEIGVGGTILKALDEGLKVGILDLTSGEPTPDGSEELRIRETEAATACLGITWRDNLKLANRKLEATLDDRRALANMFRITRPRMILAPWAEDVHPDHVRASQLCDDARFWSKLSRTDLEGEPYWPEKMLYYLSVHLRIHPKPSIVVDISEHIEKKMEAIRCYQSQMKFGQEMPFPSALDDIRDRARYWGWSIHAAYGEPLISREEVGTNSVRGLL